MAKAVAINVGVNKNPDWGGFRGPIFSDGSFEFIHIPWREGYGMIEPPPKKYSGMHYSQYVPNRLKNEHVLVSPDFDNCTYASTIDAPANKRILYLKKGDALLFYSTLDFKNERGKNEDWINPRWGAYIVGLFKVDFVYESLLYVLDDEAAIEAFQEYTWFKSLLERGVVDDGAPWVKGVKEESGLLERAIPLNSPENSQKWSNLAIELFRTAGKNPRRLDINKKAIPQTVLTCEGECLNKFLTKCSLRKTNR